MKLICKQKEPREWVEYRNTPGADYEAIPELRRSLYMEQGGICAYCMRRLSDEFDSERSTENKVEHVRPRQTCEDAQARMEYTNLLMCCSGTISGTAYSQTHCDTHKGSRTISFTPTDPEFIKTLYYNNYGKIFSTDPLFNEEINSVLNLNHPRLVENRKQLIFSIITWLSNSKPSKGQIQKHIEKYQSRDRNGFFTAYCEAAVWRLKKSLKGRL